MQLKKERERTTSNLRRQLLLSSWRLTDNPGKSSGRKTGWLTLPPWPCSPCCIWQSALAWRCTQPAWASGAASAAGRPERRTEGAAGLRGEEGRGEGRKERRERKKNNKNKAFWNQRTVKNWRHRTSKYGAAERSQGWCESANKKKRQQEGKKKSGVWSTSPSSRVHDKSPLAVPRSSHTNRPCNREPLEMKTSGKRRSGTTGSHDQLDSEEKQRAQKQLLEIHFKSDRPLDVQKALNSSVDSFCLPQNNRW